jgi:hypothetical protein
MLDGLGASGAQQPDHLRHRFKNRATGLDSGEPILNCALRRKPSNLVQGRVLLNRAAYNPRLRLHCSCLAWWRQSTYAAAGFSATFI